MVADLCIRIYFYMDWYVSRERREMGGVDFDGRKIVPVFPFALEERTGIEEDEVQRWVSVLMAVYGAGLLVASRMCPISPTTQPANAGQRYVGIWRITHQGGWFHLWRV